MREKEKREGSEGGNGFQHGATEITKRTKKTFFENLTEKKTKLPFTSLTPLLRVEIR
jgi:hypothetical protein